MSLKNARLPSLRDKLDALEVTVPPIVEQAEKKADKEDEKVGKKIKKLSKKDE